ASQMTPAILKTTSIEIEAGDYLLRASGSILHFPGFMVLYIEAGDDDAPLEERKIPVTLFPGESLTLLDIIPEQHFTKPPPRYTEATLVKELDTKGIGRPSTYAQIISTILDREYVKKEKGRFLATELGLTVNDLLISSFPDIFNVEFTAKMESDLDRIETGEDHWVNVVQTFYGPFQQDLQTVTERSRTLKQALQQVTDEMCDLCGRPMVVKWGRNGKFMACSGYPVCRNTKPLEQLPQVPPHQQTCDKCGSPMQVKSGRYGPFLACSNYPTCQNTQPISLGVPCPVDGCGGKIVEKRTKRGKTFYGCSRYPSCRYATWDRPVDQPCPSCGAPFLLSKQDHLKCPKCQYESGE
ncbi:MAG: topoisomerase DNA-binding C4 zinc finger domain-containing protein, partial [Candidatus Latescibacteria bacterium]|nr:topoisomerase DNA-binding C4 zinc finger domain-containing protein [Candidatus Latescibacterota bacterium]